ncbi:MAG: EhbH [Methanobrevibacter sp.]|nr:EhbH [Candidatus Methanovirga basalitermitum]
MENNSLRTLILVVSTALFTVSLFSALFELDKLITPGVSEIYNRLGTGIAPNMVTLIVFDWRGYDTLGEALILVSSVVVVLLVFGRGILKDDD